MNKKVNLNLVLVLAVASVILIPIAYGLVEPSVIINMEPSQTTKPIQIKDNLGTVVFSVDVDGTVFPPQGGDFIFTADLNLLEFNKTGDTIVASTFNEGTNDGGVDDTFLILAEWTITSNEPADIDLSGFDPSYSHVQLVESYVYVEWHRDGTSNNGNTGGKSTRCQLEWNGHFVVPNHVANASFWYKRNQGASVETTHFVAGGAEKFIQNDKIVFDSSGTNALQERRLGTVDDWTTMKIQLIAYHEIKSNNSPHESITDDGNDCDLRNIDAYQIIRLDPRMTIVRTI